MSAHSEAPYITASMEFSSGEGVVQGRWVQQLAVTLGAGVRGRRPVGKEGQALLRGLVTKGVVLGAAHHLGAVALERLALHGVEQPEPHPNFKGPREGGVHGLATRRSGG